MVWHPPERFPSFLLWLTRFAEHLGIDRKCVCLEQAYFHYRRGDDPFPDVQNVGKIAMTAAVTPGREDIIASVAASLEGRSFAYTQGEHHRRFATKVVDDVLAAKPADPDAMNERRALEDTKLASNVREATLAEIAKLADDVWEALKFYADAENYRSGDTHVNGMTRPVMQDAGNKARAALSTTGEPKRCR